MKHPATFVAIDGEGKSLEDGSHLYTMLCSSTRWNVSDESGLDSYKCFEFLLDLKEANPGAQFVGFSINYDVNMMLGNIPKACMRELWKEHKTSWRLNGTKWYLEWIPSKLFHIMTFKGAKVRSVRIWDVFGFFQKSFVKTLEEWKVGTVEQVSAISAMKDQRSSFGQDSSGSIMEYCYQECELLVTLMDTLEAAFIEANILLDGYHGAGAAATAIMKREHVKPHIERYELEIEEACLRAYFGGRTEIFRVGSIGTVHNYDINSAYPSACLELPTMHGEWTYAASYDKSARYALWLVQWDVLDPTLAPFPYRLDKRIVYSRNGRGWYHASETRAALDCYGRQCDVVHGFVFTPTEPDTRPFSFVRDIYAQRRAHKDRGSMAEKPLKLGINSLYGKLAQGYGHDKLKPPAYQSYFWAGMITAHTRAQILRAVYPVRDALIGIATDGIFTTEPIELDFGKHLGEWDYKCFESFFSAQPGVYAGIVDGRQIQRNRGFSTRELDFTQLTAKFAQFGMGASVNYEVTRFVGYGSATENRLWRTWTKQSRKLSINCGFKYEGENDRLILGTVPEGRMSDRYQPKMNWYDFDGATALYEEIEGMDA